MRTLLRRSALALAAALVLATTPSQALAPVIVLLVKEMVQQSVTAMIKDTLLASLRGLGCKGMALANALEALDLRKGPGGLPMLPGLSSGLAMPGMPALPAGMNLPPMPGGAGGATGALPAGMSGVSPEMAARLGAMMPNPASLPPGMGLDADQAAMMQRMLAGLGQPLSPPQTLAAIDELAELGFLPKPVQTELKECMLLVPAAIPALGMGMGLLRPIIPQLRQARDELRALSPEEQDEVAALFAQELEAVSPEQRKDFIEQLGGGFFPPRISEGVKARLAVR